VNQAAAPATLALVLALWGELEALIIVKMVNYMELVQWELVPDRATTEKDLVQPV